MLKKIKNNNKGVIYVLRVLSYLLLIILISFMIDTIILITQNIVTSYEAAYYAEKISIQGGPLGGDYILHGPSSIECQKCMINSDFSFRISKTMKLLGVSPSDWEASIIDTDNREFFIHKDGSSTNNRIGFEYMEIGTFSLKTVYRPKILTWLWPGRPYTIEKKVPFVVEHIPK